jgi:hypothetical protein
MYIASYSKIHFTLFLRTLLIDEERDREGISVKLSGVDIIV